MSIDAMKIVATGLPATIEEYQLALNAAFAGGKAAGQAIAELEKQEPVGVVGMDVIVVNLVREGINKHRARELAEHFIKHTHPQPKREWVGLTQNQINSLCEMSEIAAAVVATELLLKEKNL